MACVGLRCCLLFGVRMARIGFKCIDIYLYTDDVARDCGAFSCPCRRAGGLCYMYGCMQGLFRVVWWWCGVYISMYNALVAGVVVVWCWRSVCDRYI